LYNEAGTLELRYNSYSVNQTYWGRRDEAKRFHRGIAAALKKETGLKVVPDKRLKK
jgi:hypothetical protein